jgi:hypothetical protein
VHLVICSMPELALILAPVHPFALEYKCITGSRCMAQKGAQKLHAHRGCAAIEDAELVVQLTGENQVPRPRENGQATGNIHPCTASRATSCGIGAIADDCLDTAPRACVAERGFLNAFHDVMKDCALVMTRGQSHCSAMLPLSPASVT